MSSSEAPWLWEPAASCRCEPEVSGQLTANWSSFQVAVISKGQKKYVYPETEVHGDSPSLVHAVWLKSRSQSRRKKATHFSSDVLSRHFVFCQSSWPTLSKGSSVSTRHRSLCSRSRQGPRHSAGSQPVREGPLLRARPLVPRAGVSLTQSPSGLVLGRLTWTPSQGLGRKTTAHAPGLPLRILDTVTFHPSQPHLRANSELSTQRRSGVTLKDM